MRQAITGEERSFPTEGQKGRRGDRERGRRNHISSFSWFLVSCLPGFLLCLFSLLFFVRKRSHLRCSPNSLFPREFRVLRGFLSLCLVASDGFCHLRSDGRAVVAGGHFVLSALAFLFRLLPLLRDMLHQLDQVFEVRLGPAM